MQLSSKLLRLQKLEELYPQGLISDAEYAAKKQQLLGSLWIISDRAQRPLMRPVAESRETC